MFTNISLLSLVYLAYVDEKCCDARPSYMISEHQEPAVFAV